MSRYTRSIGVIAGMGPFAGLDLLNKMAALAASTGDKDHPTVISISAPSEIPDRAAFLLGEHDVNPGDAIADQIFTLERAGCSVIGMPCNTAHAPPILDRIQQRLGEDGFSGLLVNMIDEVGAHIQEKHAAAGRVALLATTGTYSSDLYRFWLEERGIDVSYPDGPGQALVQSSIDDPVSGLKYLGAGALSVVGPLTAVSEGLASAGAEALILGCTEIPLVLTEREVAGLPTIDPAMVLAEKLLRSAAAS